MPAPVAQLDALTTRVLAPNPSPMTLEGTNTYLLGAAGSGGVVVVDPGPDIALHRRAVEAAIAARDAEVVAVVLTHHHGDHAQAAGWAARWEAPLRCFDPGMVPAASGVPRTAVLPDGATVDGAGVVIEALHTPGHSSDHLCLRVRDSGVLLTGDHVLGRGTTVVAWPDGDMADYVASLRRLAQVPAKAIYPGHGPPLQDAAATVQHYLDHRAEREQQILAAVRAGDRTPAQVVARVYADVDVALHPAAQRSVRAHLAKLVAEGQVSPHGDPDGAGGMTYRA